MANPAMDNRSEETALNDHNNSGDHALTPNGGGILDTSGSSPGGLLMSHHISAAALNSYNMQPLAAGGAGDGLGGDGGAKAPLSLPLKQR